VNEKSTYEELEQRIKQLEEASRDAKRVEAALAESEGKFRILADSTPAAVMLYQDDHWIYANRAAEAISGYSANELMSMKFWDFAHPDYRSLIEKHGRKRQTGEETINRHEFKIITKNGTEKWVDLAGASTMIGGRLAGIISVVDITERKLAEAELLESEEKYRLVVENAREAIVVTQDAKVSFANQMSVDILGYSQQELTSRPFTDFIHPEDRSMVLVNHIKRLKGEEVSPIYSYRTISAEGSIRWAETNSILIRWKGKPAVLNFLNDITERKITEEALRNSEQFLRLITDNIQDAIRVVDLRTMRYTYANPYCQKLFGTASKNFIDQEVGFNLDAEEKKRLFQVLRDELDQDKQRDPNRHVLFELQEKNLLDNAIIWTENKASFIRDADGNPSAVLSITRDITERKKMEDERQKLQERIRRAEKMEAIGTLAGGVAHDLNNVLGVLVGYSELMLEKIPEGSPLKKYADNILQSGLRGAAIIQDLLTLARRGVAISEVVNLNQVITDYFKTPVFENIKAFHPRVTFKTDLGKDLLNIKGSPVHLGTTIMNLISNAAEAISGEGEVSVRTENRYLEWPIRGYDVMQEGDYVVLTVSDNGRGISPQDIGKIFEPFYTKKVMGRSGTGLGLAVVWGTVKDHNGYIDVQSEEGSGSLFILYFPVTRDESATVKISLSPDAYMGRGESILVVDDVKEQRALAVSMLERLGYAASAVSSGEEAIVYIKDKKVDLMVLDMIMDPGMDGLDTYKNVLEIQPKQKAIIVSGFSESDRVHAAQALGAGAYVRKPYVMEKLGLAVRNELDKK